MPEPLPWPVIPGSPLDVTQAKINLLMTEVRWRNSATDFLTGATRESCTYDELETALREHRAAQKRFHARQELLRFPHWAGLAGAATEVEYYGGAA